MQFRNFSQNRIQFYYAIACIILLSLIIVDNIFAQTPALDPPVPQVEDEEIGDRLNPIRSSRINSINDRIELLKKLLAEEPQSDATMDANSRVPEVTPIEPKSSDTAPRELESPVEIAAETETGNVVEPAIETTFPKNPIPVSTETLDSFQLGNSLFMTGNYSAAIKSFEDALKIESNQDDTWTKCMLGCCYRLNGDHQKAEAIFREISNNKKADPYVVEHARWFLTYIEIRRKTNSEFLAIESEINDALERLGNEKS